MNFETVKKNNKTKMIIVVCVLLVLTSVVMFVSTRAKYRSVQSVRLANGVVDYKVPDLKLAMKVSEDGVNYTSSSEIPTGNYTFNTEKSKCRIPTSTLNGENAPVDESVTIEYTDGKLNFRGLTHNDTKCYVYFDKVQGQTSSTIIADIKNRTDGSYKGSTLPTFTSVATGTETEANNGIFETDDPMYGENAKTYYWRGAATTNYVIFDKKCWRIVRINGDGSIRLIYNGAIQSENTCPGNGANSSSVVLQGTAYNGTFNNSKYVGWTYSSSDIQRPGTAKPQTSGEPAPLKTALETWYSTNITNRSKVVKGYFCNDRNTKDNETWRGTGSTQYYAAYQRLSSGTKTPQLSCPDGDVYSLDVGMITADEVQFAGASAGTTNKSYYLYNGQYYWTMSPYHWNSGGPAYVFYVDRDNGRLSYCSVGNTTPRVRPVINLSANTLFAVGGNGTASNPYVVS